MKEWFIDVIAFFVPLGFYSHDTPKWRMEAVDDKLMSGGVFLSLTCQY